MCVLPVLGIVASIRVWLFLRHGVRVIARIVGYEIVKLRPEGSASSETDDQRLPIVTFRDEKGMNCTVTLSTERALNERGVGDDEIRIIYPRGRPYKAKVDDWG